MRAFVSLFKNTGLYRMSLIGTESVRLSAHSSQVNSISVYSSLNLTVVYLIPALMSKQISL